jgi:DNA repair protein RadB
MKTERLTSGNAGVDKLLGGGFEPRTLTQIFGGPATGKSTFCMVAAVSCLKAGGSVVFIDSEGFSIERFRQVAGAEADAIAERLYLFEPIDFEQQGSMITEADKVLRLHAPTLFILDSATALYRTDLEKGQYAMQQLTRQMLQLLGYAKRYELSVLVTNQVYMDTSRNTYAGLGGTSLEHISKAIIRLDRLEGTPWRKATLTKHRSRPEGQSFEYGIVQDGIKEKA